LRPVTPVPAASAYEVVLAVHVMATVVAFGVTFAYPIMFAVGAKRDPRSLPTLHRVEYTIERWLINPGLLVVLGAGIYLASDGHRWGQFFVQWGLAATIVIGGLVGSVMIPTAKRAEALAQAAVAAAGARAPDPGEDYRTAVRRLSLAGGLSSALVLVTIAFMVIKP
jgi:Predicted integral membrane protein (DUF2269)